jgi:hypothetical protein
MNNPLSHNIFDWWNQHRLRKILPQKIKKKARESKSGNDIYIIITAKRDLEKLFRYYRQIY